MVAIGNRIAVFCTPPHSHGATSSVGEVSVFVHGVVPVWVLSGRLIIPGFERIEQSSVHDSDFDAVRSASLIRTLTQAFVETDITGNGQDLSGLLARKTGIRAQA